MEQQSRAPWESLCLLEDTTPRSRRLVGLDVRRLVLLIFALSTVLAAIAGVLLVARKGNANPQVGGQVLTLPALAAAFLDAPAIKPGRFTVVGTLLAVFFVAFALSGLNLDNVDQWITDFFTGAALVAAVALSTVHRPASPSCVGSLPAVRAPAGAPDRASER